jgi:hypothetical protein
MSSTEPESRWDRLAAEVAGQDRRARLERFAIRPGDVEVTPPDDDDAADGDDDDATGREEDD